MAADSAVMLLDNRKGVEEQTRKLFEVCRLRKTPVFTFVNKCDRPGESPLKLIDDVERELGMRCYPMMWPIVDGDRFVGVYDRATTMVHLFERGEDHGQSRIDQFTGSLDDTHILEAIPESALNQLLEDLELLDMAGGEFTREAFLAGEVSPVFFGSALTNFGLEPFLRRFLELAPSPTPRDSTAGEVDPLKPEFTGFVFKIQANMDPKHRDRIAFVRVCSGRFEAGMQVKHVRSGKPIRLAAPTQFLARERTLIDEAWPGDVIGIHDRGNLRIGDTLSADGDLEFAGIPRFSPEHFARIVITDPMKRKQLDTGLQQLSEEGAAQVFYAESITGPAPIVGAVGQLQFDVLLHRLEHEYNVKARLEHMSFVAARWVVAPRAEVNRLAGGHGRMLVYDAKQAPLVLFDSEWTMRTTIDREKGIAFHDVAP
jgi:peptide chain release factor 3